jgi:hypothetical protein
LWLRALFVINRCGPAPLQLEPGGFGLYSTVAIGF